MWGGSLILLIILLTFCPAAAQDEPLDTTVTDTAAYFDTSKFQPPINDPREEPEQADASYGPSYCIATHNIGNLVFPVTNFGRIGTADEVPFTDCFTGLKAPNGQYPKGSKTINLFKGGLWIGAIVGRDTLVTCGADVNVRYRELNPLPSPYGDMIRRSTLETTWNNTGTAVSEQDYIASFNDTMTQGVRNPSFDAVDNRSHTPLPIEVIQNSYAWSYQYADDFALFDTRIRNIGTKPLKEVYVGLYMDIDVHQDRLNPFSQQYPPPGKIITEGRDDITGFLPTHSVGYTDCYFEDTINLAWTSDNDGDFSWDVPLSGNVTGVRFLKGLAESKNLSFNWWVWNYNSALDFGPQTRAKFRRMTSGVGTPAGDRNKYYMMVNGEIDYDQVRTAQISSTDLTWTQPNTSIQRSISLGADGAFVLSVGPFDIYSGQEILVPWAYVGGTAFHVDPVNHQRYMRFQYNPARFLQGLNFTPLARNAVWASWVYDNPGIDSDNDGYFGQYVVCPLDSQLVDGHWVTTQAETTWYEGDGIPDLKGAAPPAPPKVWVHRIPNGFRIRFNGRSSEESRDVFSRLLDFEGYRVYVGRDDREGSYTMIASYDRENYDKWVYNAKKKPQAGYDLVGPPLTLENLRCLYGDGADPCADSGFSPLKFVANSPYIHPDFPMDSAFYFTVHDYNASELGVTTRIQKIYPDEPPPSDGIPTPEQLTDDGYLKYYEYECSIDDLLPSVPYFINVTAFDFGSPESNLQPLETSRTVAAIQGYPEGTDDPGADGKKAIYVYPNPYRLDAKYRAQSYEGVGREDRPDDRVRLINFANLPAICTIRIYSLDGDLIRQLDHRFDEDDPLATHDTWDLITRNTQLVVSGIYYWTVEDEKGNVTIGKFVIIM